MKKNTAKFFAMLLLIALATTLLASCGIIVPGEYRFGLATLEGDNSQIAAAVILDSSDRIALVRIDEIENGKTRSKKDMGDAYGMVAFGGASAEWYEQIAHLERELIGKTVEEVAETDADDADIKAGCTIYIGSYLSAVALAAERAKVNDAFTSTVDHIAISLSLIAGKAGADGEHTVAVSAAALDRGYIMAQESYFCGAIPAEYRLGLATVKTSDGKIAAAVITDENNRVVAVKIDEIANGSDKSKKELGDAYGMFGSGWGSSLAEWDDQVAHLEGTLVGKNSEQILGVSSSDADVVTGCTIYVGNLVKAVAKAIDNAKTSQSFTAIAEDITVTLDISPDGSGDFNVSAEASVSGTKVLEKTEDASAPEELRFGMATVETASGQVAAAVVIDALNRVQFVRIDELDLSAGKTDSKKTQGDAYGMLSGSPYWGSQLAEWDDQITYLENSLVGKTLDEVSGVTTGSADIVAGCTVSVDNYISAVAAAINAAKGANEFVESKNDVLLTLTLTATGGGTYAITASATVDANSSTVASGVKTATKTVANS